MIWKDLPWDSDFFGCRIAAAYQEQGDEAETLRKLCREAAVDCLYLFLNHPLTAGFGSVLQEAGAVCADLKTTFRKNNLQRWSADESFISIPDEISEECYRLAVRSGWKSRFYVDEKFRPMQDALYRKWVDTCSGNRPDAKVWEFHAAAGQLQGMMCAGIEGKTGKLGLISVSPDCQGRGIGSCLMRILENFYLDHGCTSGEIVTQFDNSGACGLYRKFGYRITDIKEVWHLWKV